MDLQEVLPYEALLALATPVRPLVWSGPHVYDHIGIVGENHPPTIHRQWALPFSIDAQDPQLPVVTGHVGGARGVHTQTLRGVAALRATVSDVIAVVFRDENKDRESNGIN